MNAVTQSGILNVHVADHLPVYLLCKKITVKLIKMWITGRSYLKFNQQHFLNDLDDDWQLFKTTENVTVK